MRDEEGRNDEEQADRPAGAGGFQGAPCLIPVPHSSFPVPHSCSWFLVPRASRLSIR